MQPGATGEDVKKLQNYLVSLGLMTQEQVNTGYGTYGPQTTAAVKALQDRLGVDSSTGPGYFGPRTIQAITSASGGVGTGAGGASTPIPNKPSPEHDAALAEILKNPNLSADQKAFIQSFYDTVTTNDVANSDKIIAAFNAATKYSDPYFKAQTLIATDALSRALGATDGDLSFNEEKLRNTLKDLEANTSASKDYLSFQHTQELKKLEDSYRNDLETTRTDLASVGKTSSSVRSRAETMLNENNQGLVESSNRQFSYQTGNLDRTLSGASRDTASSLAYLQDKATQDRISLLRTAEGNVGSEALSKLGYTGLLGGVGGSIPRQQVQDALSFSNSFVF